MKLSEVLNVFVDLEDYIEGISFDGDPYTFKLDIAYPSEEVDDDGQPAEFYSCNISLFYPDGNGIVEFSDNSYVPTEMILYLSEILNTWKNFCKSRKY